MSIASQIQRLQNDSAAIAAAITAKGVTVPAGSGYDDYAELIESIQAGGSGYADFLTYIDHYQFTNADDRTTLAKGGTTKYFYDTYISPYFQKGRIVKAVISNNTASGNRARHAIYFDNIGVNILAVRGSATSYTLCTIEASWDFFMTTGAVIDIYVYDTYYFVMPTDITLSPFNFVNIGMYQATEGTDQANGSTNYFYNTYIAPYAGAGRFIKCIISNNSATSYNVRSVLSADTFGTNLLTIRANDTTYVQRARNNFITLAMSAGTIITTCVYETNIYEI